MDIREEDEQRFWSKVDKSDMSIEHEAWEHAHKAWIESDDHLPFEVVGAFMHGAVWASQCEPTDAEIEAAAKAHFEHYRAKRPEDHGPYETWEQLDEDYREYCRGGARAALSARNTRENQA